jgi:hypothetical protein
MTVTSSFATIADSISKLAIPGVTVKDIDEIPQSARLLCPLLIPQPDNFVTEFEASFESFGSNGDAAINLRYSLNYMYLHSEAGAGVAPFDMYGGLVHNLSAILVAILSNDAVSGLVDMKPRIGQIGIITDPSGVEYWGIQFSLPILEYSQ